MITYVKGDATRPHGEGSPGEKYIVHVCNNLGGWGRGFVLALSKRWKEPEAYYRHVHKTQGLVLGTTQFVPVIQTFDGDIVTVINMIAQEGYGPNNMNLHRIDGVADGKPPIRYDALRECLRQVYEQARIENATVHMPRIGCGLAGGDWSVVEKIVTDTFCDVSVTVYDL